MAPRLFVDFLEHEMPVLPSFDRVRRQIAFADRTDHRAAGGIHDLDRLATQLGDIAFFQEHEAARDGQQRGNVRGDEVFIDAETDGDGTPLARHHDAFRIRLADHRQGIGALQFGHGLANRRIQIRRPAQVMMNPVRDDLGIGFRGKEISQRFEPRTQRLVIFDDAVVDDGNPVAGYVRVGVFGGGNPVGGPACVRNADVAADGGGVERFLKDLHLAHGAQAGEPPRLEYRDAGRIVAAILQPAQSLHQNGDCIAFRDHTDDSTHAAWAPFAKMAD